MRALISLDVLSNDIGGLMIWDPEEDTRGLPTYDNGRLYIVSRFPTFTLFTEGSVYALVLLLLLRLL